jgi:hypothetical protein
MNDQQLLDALQAKIKERAPNFEILFKDQNGFMKFLGILMFFNKGFMTKFITTIKEKVYWTSKKSFEECPLRSFLTLSHEYVHIMDYVAHPVRFVLGYLFPQILAVFSLFAVFAFISPVPEIRYLYLFINAPLPVPVRTTFLTVTSACSLSVILKPNSSCFIVRASSPEEYHSEAANLP